MISIPKPMEGKICLVTGATSGIGAETSLELARQGAATIIVGRNKKRCEKTVKKIKTVTGNPKVEYMLADLSSQKDIYHLYDQFKSQYQSLDVLINNVGAKFVKRQVSVEGFEMSFALNYLGYFLLTNLMMGMLTKSGKARIINVSSGAHGGCSEINFDDLYMEKEYVGKQAYAQSKLANILFTYELARRLEGTEITVNALHPGGVATNFCRNNGWVSWLKHITAHVLARNLVGPAEGAKTSIYLATSPEVEGVSGKYFSNQKPVRSSEVSYDIDAASRLWDVSLELTGLSKS